jgi:hypothetical protein
MMVSLAVLTLKPSYVQAQATEGLQAELSASFVYGEAITFDVYASSPLTLTGARLTIQVANRPALYTESVAVTPNTTISLSHSVQVSTLELPPFARLTYYWDFQDEVGREYRTTSQSLLYEDTNVPWQWSVESRSGIFVHTDGEDETLTRAALDIASAALLQASDLLATPVLDEVHVYIYPELAQLANSLRLHGRRVQDWIVAYTIPDQYAVFVSATTGPEMVANLQRDLPHEMMHLVIYTAAGSYAYAVPAWFNEGLALMSSAEPDPTLHNVLDTAVNEGVLLSLEPLCISNFNSFDPHDAALAYAQSESLMRYISNRYGASQLRALMSAFGEGLSCEAATERALGLTLTDLEEQWHNDLMRTAARSPRTTISLLPWLVVWIISWGVALLFIAPQPKQFGVSPSVAGTPLKPPSEPG